MRRNILIYIETAITTTITTTTTTTTTRLVRFNTYK
jgi:hypothetical protein